MALVPGNHVRERADADRLAARDAAPAPGVGVERAQQRHGRRARGTELSEEISERAAVELGDRHIGVLVETGQRCGVAARDPQRAVRHDALDVAQMADDFLDAPLAALVPVHRLRVGEAAQQVDRLFDLRRAHHHRVELGNALDVADIMRWNLVGLRPSGGSRVHDALPPSSVSAMAFTVLPSPVRMRRW